MKNGNHHTSLARRIFLSLISVAFVSVLIFAFFYVLREVTSFYKEADQLKHSYSENKKFEIKYKILQIKDYIEWVLNQPQSPLAVTQEKLKTYALDSISKIRFAANDYVFVNTLSGMALLTNGRYNNPPLNILTSGDSSWIDIFTVQQSAALHPEGVFHTYSWPKLSPGKSIKTSYFSYIHECDWIIGTGFYEDDIDSIIQQRRKEMLNELMLNMVNIFIYLLLAILACYVLVKFFSRRIERDIGLFNTFFEKSATENKFIDKSKVYYKEFVFMAESANLMVERRKMTEAAIHAFNIKLEQKVDERTRQFEISNSALESFSYSVSHDLRAPLRAILGFSQILSTRHRGALNEEGRQYMDYVVEASMRMELLINDLLDYSRLSRKQADFRTVDLAGLFENIHMVFRQQLEEIGGRFVVRKDLPEIESDSTLLHQIFTNLVSNAIAYRRTGVPLLVEIGYQEAPDGFLISLSDNGIGIAKEFWIKIFDVFQRLHSDDTHPGTGIGLASVKKAVTLLGGTVWVESVVNQGSNFYIKFPYYKPK